MRRAIATAAMVLVSNASPANAEPVTLRIKTVVPRETRTPWRVGQENIQLRSGAETSVSVSFEFSTHEDRALESLQNGDVDGAVVPATSLTSICPDATLANLPGVSDHEEYRRFKLHIRDYLYAQCEHAGVQIIGWVLVGLYHYMSRNQALQAPHQLAHFKPCAWRGDRVQQELLGALNLGGAPPADCSSSTILTKLTNGEIDLVPLPLFYASITNVLPRMQYVWEQPAGMVSGFLVMRKDWSRSVAPQDAARFRAIVRDTETSVDAKVETEDDRVRREWRDRVNWVRRKPEQDCVWLRQAMGPLKRGVLQGSVLDAYRKHVALAGKCHI